jgi:hypothetical protein
LLLKSEAEPRKDSMQKMIATGALSLVVAGWLVALPAAADSSDLLALMGRMQTFAHKLQLSLEHRNARLADFYLHELEETSEDVVENIDRYGDHPVGKLVKEMLLPAIERAEDALETGDWAAVGGRYAELVQACNSCHQVTGHEFIRIAPAEGNPFAQDFTPKED